MGNDGGSIPGRQDLVKSRRRKNRSYTEELVKKSKGKYCSMSKEPLKKPIVGDRLGQIYNKTAVLQGLLQKNIPSSFGHITSLKDVKDLNVELSDKGNIECPITLVEFSGINKFFFIWNCGCVVSQKAIDELKIKNKCPVCGKEFEAKELISLNYTKEEKQKIQKILLEEKVKAKKAYISKELSSLSRKRKRGALMSEELNVKKQKI